MPKSHLKTFFFQILVVGDPVQLGVLSGETVTSLTTFFSSYMYVCKDDIWNCDYIYLILLFRLHPLQEQILFTAVNHVFSRFFEVLWGVLHILRMNLKITNIRNERNILPTIFLIPFLRVNSILMFMGLPGAITEKSIQKYN